MKYYRVLPLVISATFCAFAEDKPLTIGWANVQWPPATNHIVSATNRTPTIYGQVWIDGVSNQPGATPKLIAQLGLGPARSNPHGNANWSWVDATYNLDVGNNDEFMASLLPDRAGSFDYLYRYSTTGGSNWVYADLKGLVANGQAPESPGKLTVGASNDTTPPPSPSGLVVASTSPSEIKLAWRKVVGDPTLFGYEVLRSANGGNTYSVAALLTTNAFTDSTVKRGTTYFYKVRAVDLSFNRSETSAEINVSPDASVTVTFNVSVPQTTESAGKPVFLAGTLSQLNGGMPDWDPGSLIINRVDANHWTMTLCGKEGALVAYKYTLGSWDNVEKGEKCDEITDRQLKLTPDANGKMIVDDTVLSWRNIAPCKD